MVKKTLNDNEIEVLTFLAEYARDCECCWAFKYIDADLSLKEIKIACRSLADKGLTKFHRGLMDEDGKVAGSGYCSTQQGIEFIEELNKQKKEPTSLQAL